MPLTEYDFSKKYLEGFKNSELGCIRELLPIEDMAREFQRRSPKKGPQGRKPVFPIEGEIALMFLKAYMDGISDDGLIEALNGSLHMQFFCGVLIDRAHPLEDGKIVSAIRNRLGRILDIKAMQKLMFQCWKGDIKGQDQCMVDATCYESHMRYPTDVKRLWECCEWLWALICKTCKELGERRPRNKPTPSTPTTTTAHGARPTIKPPRSRQRDPSPRMSSQRRPGA